MGIKDPHDPREFQHHAVLASDGTVAAIVEVAAGSEAPAGAIDVTDLYPYDFRTAKIKKAVLTKGDPDVIRKVLKDASDAAKAQMT